MAEGIARTGDQSRLIEAELYRGTPDADVAVFYGFQPVLRRIMADYTAAGGHAVHIDLGYWSRRHNGSRYGYHRFSLDAHHPTAYFQRIKHAADRLEQLDVALKTWRGKGSHILLCGMSDKAAGVVGLKFLEWETNAAKQIRQVTDRAIVYRPKHRKDRRYDAIAGTTLVPPKSILDKDGYPISDIEQALHNAFCVVSHHSNAGIDAIMAGVPCFQLDGIAAPMGLADLALLETPKQPTDGERRQWANDVAYTQFSLQEMRAGLPWRHFKNEGLIP